MWMEKENGMNNERACSTGKLATTIIYCDVPSGITAWICEFLCLSLRNSRRITSGRTRRLWRRLATAHFSLKSLLKSPDISKCRSSVSSWVKWQNEGCLRRLGDHQPIAGDWICRLWVVALMNKSSGHAGIWWILVLPVQSHVSVHPLFFQ